MLEPIIIGFAGNIGAGKTFCAEYMAQRYGFRRRAYGTSLKEACRAMFGFNDTQLYGPGKGVESREWGFTPRWALQIFGTQCMREFFATMAVNAGFWTPEEANDIWVRSLHYKLREESAELQESKKRPLFVIDDVRFKNEYDYVRGFKHGYMVKVLIDGTPLKKSGAKAHASETGLGYLDEDHWDAVFINETSRGGLEPYSDAILAPLRAFVESVL